MDRDAMKEIKRAHLVRVRAEQGEGVSLEDYERIDELVSDDDIRYALPKETAE